MSPTKHSITWEEIQKAKQRLSRESGAIIKDWGGRLPLAFVYPNSYYIGMSNLGLQTIYGYLNYREETVCERVFWDKKNQEKRALPVSIESQRPLSDFAILAFSLNYEIDYFNIAPILKASGIPLYSKERDETQPLIIAGGPCITANPMPVMPFFDCLCIGEAEALLPVILPAIAEGISGNREDLLKILSRIPGIYVPRINSSTPVVRQWVKNLDEYPVHSIVLTRDTELKDLYLIEIERGCAHGCRFCLVNSAFSPMRFHSLDTLLEQAREGLKYRKRLGLVGPAVTDHPQIEEILTKILHLGAQISISSLRLASLNPRIIGQLAQGALHSMAIAPEAGSECLREVIHKGIHEQDVLNAVEMAAKSGMQQLKLYFMIGLPRETDEDIQAIADLTLASKKAIDGIRGRTRITLNVSPFVPKAGTPFQWLPLAPLDVLRQRIAFLKSRLGNQGIQINSESPQWSEVQAVFSRGDTDLAQALAEIDQASLPAWRQASEKHNIDVDFYAHQRWSSEQKLPWAIIQSGSVPGRLINELIKAESS